ncbi:YdhK family protein [Bacillaceae bacterium CLA-AA-H227]|uniref:YdhK family protein n=1 Tax=Robertmurraya yapensis (ex Hitch et al 2024) TaxID=3133160 RepID=A0ACC6SBI0_9BACI
MQKKRLGLFVLIAALFLVLSACSEEKEETADAEKVEHTDGTGHENMDMSSSGEIPEGLKEAENPTFEVGSKAIIESDHMAGMKGAEATIVGAYSTTVYAISYTPTNGGDKVDNHKWVIHEELIDAGDEPLAPGEEAKTDASHMEGMADATVTIDTAEDTTVYMVDFTTTDGQEVKNHKWVTESELSPVK